LTSKTSSRGKYSTQEAEQIAREDLEESLATSVAASAVEEVARVSTFG
jgi:hypothetical protein